MPSTRLIRSVTFAAAHRYWRDDRTADWNRERFGDQVNRHGHNYRVEVVVEGEPDPETGFVVDLPLLDRALAEVVGPLDKRELNQVVPEVRDGRMQPSTEALARWFYDRLDPLLPPAVRLHRLRVWEDDTLGAEVERDP
jgi:6-pyruvoyltetrahydropterin/6-carboxytetrahydropterin synthase